MPSSKAAALSAFLVYRRIYFIGLLLIMPVQQILPAQNFDFDGQRLFSRSRETGRFSFRVLC